MTEEYKEELIWLFLEGKEEDFFKKRKFKKRK